MKYYLCFILTAIFCYCSYGQTSVNNKIIVDAHEKKGLAVKYNNSGKMIPVAIIVSDEVSPIGETDRVEVNYEMVTGKRRICRNEYVEQKYLTQNGDTLTVRVYEDGIAWKLPGSTRIQMESPKHNWIQNWTDSYESFFPRDREIKIGERYAYPALFEYEDDCFALLTESGLSPEEAGVSMWSKGENEFDLVPDGTENGGWQTLIIGGLKDVTESTLVTDNSSSSVLEDVSWIQPGVASWVYWAYNHGSNDYDIIKRYTDLAAELQLPYVLIDAEWDEMKNGKSIEDVVKYAVDKGIKPMIWYNSSVGWIDGAPGPKFRLNTPESLEKEFAWCEKIGVKGVKIDFFSGDTNKNFKFMSELLEAAARHHLLVNFHGSPLPRGWQRTYPHFVTTEAVYGAEWYNNGPKLTTKAASHNATLPFTRNVVGSMDYTPCAFSDSQYPHITSDAHELALTSLFESGIQHLADRPESLLAQPQEVKEYLSNLPTSWDDTKLICGYPGEYVVIARRKGENWWIAGINGSDEKIEELHLDFSSLEIRPDAIKGRIFEDRGSDDKKEWGITEISSLPTKVSMLPRGGFVIVVDTL